MNREKLHLFRKRFFGFASALGIFLLELIKISVLAGVTIILVRHFLFKPFYVKGASMEPNFFEKEYLIIDEVNYRFREPKRGEVIVFKYPENPKEYFLKRIIGLPGERVKVSEGKVVVYNQQFPEGVAIKEEYLDPSLRTDGEKTIVLGDDQYFVLGDNRNNSYDSRRFGPVDKNLIVGRAWLRGWPVSRIQIFNDLPDFNF
jgi:signal peptidase I